MKKRIVLTGAIIGGIAVIAGAFGAHSLQGYLSPKSMEVWQTAVQYQFYHALALLALSTLTRVRTRFVKHCYYLFTIGISLFSGSLYLLAASKLIGISWISIIGPITPLGGILLIGGWSTLGVVGFKIK